MTESAEQQVGGSAATSPSGDVTDLRLFLGGSDVAWLVQRVRGQIASGHTGRLSGTVQLREPTADERAGALRLVGPPHRASSALHVDLGTLEDVLGRGGWPPGLAAAVLALTGPVATWPREPAAVDAAWVRAAAAFTPALLGFPALEAWWGPWCAAGELRRAAGSEPLAARRLAADAAACLCALPTSGEPMAVFARRITSDAHALDRARPLSAMVLAALRALGPGTADDGALGAGQHDPSADDDVVGARELWASAGLLLSTASATVLCLGVPGDPFARARGLVEASATATALTGWRAAWMPVVLTLDQVRSGGVGVVPPGGVVHVCRSPYVVEVVATEASKRAKLGAAIPRADRGTPILVCTDGAPSVAVLELLERLSGSGAEVRFHGDFDWEGLRIGATLAHRIGWTPWRFGAAAYEQAVASLTAGKPADGTANESADGTAGKPAHGTIGHQRRALRGPASASPWDPALADAMARSGAAIEEEDVAELLLADLLGSDEGEPDGLDSPRG